MTNQQTQLESYVNDLRNLNWALNESSMVIILDQDGRITSVNTNFINTSKYQETELVGRSLLSMIDTKAENADLRSQFPELFNGKAWSGTITHKRADNSAYWVQASIIPYVNRTIYSGRARHHKIKDTEMKLRDSLSETEATKRRIMRMNKMNNTLSMTMEKQALLDTTITSLAEVYQYDSGIVFLTNSSEWASVGINTDLFKDNSVPHYFGNVMERLQSEIKPYVIDRNARDRARLLRAGAKQ